MASCPKCGADVKDFTSSCLECGADMSVSETDTMPMPRKIGILVVVLLILALLDAVAIHVLHTSVVYGVIRAGIKVALVIGILRGSDGARIILQFMAGLGLIFGMLAVANGLGLGLDGTGGVMALPLGVVAVLWPAYVLWCIGQDDVKLWISSRAMARLS